jgi:hypothetical protein
MENFFDQFDEQQPQQAGGNFFDQFSEIPKTAQGAPVPWGEQPKIFRDRPSVGGTTPAPVNGVAVEPSEFRSSPLTSRLYRGYLTAMETPTGIEQLAARGVDYAAGGLGYQPGATAAADADAARLYAERVTAEREAGYGTQTDLSGRKTGPEFDPNRILGAVASPANLGMVKGVGAVIPAGKSLLPAIASEGARGAVFGAAQPTTGEGDFWSEKGQQAAIGAGTGAALQGAASTIGPWATKEAQALIESGVPLTIGETLGGAAKYIEDAATSTPILGSAIRWAQRRSQEGFNRSTLNEILGVVGEKSTAPVGREAIREASDKISRAYNTVVPQMKGGIDLPLNAEIASIRATVPVEKQAAFDDAIARSIIAKVDKRGRIDGRDLQAAMSDLRSESTGLIKSGGGSFYDKDLGHKLSEVHDAMTNMTERYNPQNLVNNLRRANLAFAAMTRFERAATSVGAEGGVISPAQLSNATHVMDQSARKNAVAKGEALMQQYADEAKSVTRRRVPDSGTPTRAIVAGSIYGGAGATGAVLPAMATEASLAALYTPPVQWALRSAASAAPETRAALAQALRDSSPTAITAAMPYQTDKVVPTPGQKRREALRKAIMEKL